MHAHWLRIKDKAELPASLWVIEQPIVKRKTKMVFLFFVFLARKEKRRNSTEEKTNPHLHRISCHFLWRELRPKSVFSPVRVTRISWNWNDLKHWAFACETFGIVVSMNECRAAFQSFRERTMGKTLCIESEPKKNNWNLEKIPTNREMVCLVAPDCFLFKVHNDETSSIRQWTLPPRFIAQNTVCTGKSRAVRDLVTSRGLLLQAKTTSSFVFSYRPSQADLRFFV